MTKTVAAELQKRAKDFIAKRNEEFAEKSKTLGIDEQLKTVEGLDQDMILTLAGKGVKTLDDLADLAADELMEMLGENVLSEVEANKVIMKAREHWFAGRNELIRHPERFYGVGKNSRGFSVPGNYSVSSFNLSSSCFFVVGLKRK